MAYVLEIDGERAFTFEYRDGIIQSLLGGGLPALIELWDEERRIVVWEEWSRQYGSTEDFPDGYIDEGKTLVAWSGKEKPEQTRIRRPVEPEPFKEDAPVPF